jgi:hypothetical protein
VVLGKSKLSLPGTLFKALRVPLYLGENATDCTPTPFPHQSHQGVRTERKWRLRELK